MVSLGIAATKGGIRMITTLLSFGANVNRPAAPVRGAGSPDIRTTPESALHVAARYHHDEIVEIPLAEGADIHDVGGEYSSVLGAFLGSTTITGSLLWTWPGSCSTLELK